MKTKALLITAGILLSGLILFGCSSDDDLWGSNDFVAAFKNPSESMNPQENSIEIEIVFSETPVSDGWVDIQFHSDNLIYGDLQDFTTNPEAAQGTIRVPIQKNTERSVFKVNRLAEVLPDEDKSVEFSIVQIEMPGKLTSIQGNKNVLVSFSETAALGGTLSPEVGGPNEPNQVYLELRSKIETAIRRDIWDLGFYSGDQFRVKLNTSLYMFAGQLSSTDIDQVSSSEIQAIKSKMTFLVEGSQNYVDDPTGDINGTAIAEISENDSENHVYLLKLGNEIGTDTPEPGGVAIAGAERGYKKIRILRQGDDYILQYADVNSTSHHQVVISKSEGYNFTFFSFNTENTVSVEPEANRWDLNFTVKTEVEVLPGEGYTAYGYSDYVETNPLGNVKAYRVYTDQFSYDGFSFSDINESKFELNQRTIGASWRKVTPPDKYLYDNIFYIIKDAEGNYYKLKFTALENENGVRGYPQFKYDLLR
ncbi:MAG: HmuY family protein [Weeksellaceae bacterium]